MNPNLEKLKAASLAASKINSLLMPADVKTLLAVAVEVIEGQQAQIESIIKSWGSANLEQARV